MGAQSQDTVADSGTRRGVQRRASEASGWRVLATSRWTALCAGRGSGEIVQEKVDTTETATDRRSGRIEGETENIQKTSGDRWFGRVGINFLISDRT